MYKGFNLVMQDKQWKSLSVSDSFNYKDDTFDFQSKMKKNIEKTLDSFRIDDNKLDGTKMQSNWFPQMKADIFLSHSHKDEEHAKKLSEWLYQTFGLRTFIDSLVWKYQDKLLKMIDDEYCLLKPNHYLYKERNLSTSHVHMMLACALAQMMDNCECIIFLNTPSSVMPDDTINKTASPWIYQEIAFSRLIRRQGQKDYKSSNRLFDSDTPKRSLNVSYNISLDHLIKIDVNTFRNWKERLGINKIDKGNKTLDLLYQITDGKECDNNLR